MLWEADQLVEPQLLLLLLSFNQDSNHVSTEDSRSHSGIAEGIIPLGVRRIFPIKKCVVCLDIAKY